MVKSAISRLNYSNSNNSNSNNYQDKLNSSNLFNNQNTPNLSNLSNLNGSGTSSSNLQNNGVPRQDSLGTMLNNYTTNFNNNNFTNQSISGMVGNGGMGSISGLPMNYIIPSQSSSSSNSNMNMNMNPNNPNMNINIQGGSQGNKKSGNSISLPPLKDEPAGPGSNNPNSRSNSIFNYMQFPQSGHNSISGVPDVNNRFSRQMSNLDPLLLQDLENFLSNPNNLPPIVSRQSLLDRKNSKSSKSSSIDFSSWDNFNNLTNPNNNTNNNNGMNSNSNSFSGSFSNLLQGINNVVDLSNMSAQQRRDSVMKFVSDPQSMQYLQQFYQTQQNQGLDSKRANLRQDMFKGDDKKDNSLKPPNNALSPTSSLSSKSDIKHDVPQSPKTSPNYPNNNVPQMNLNYASNQNMSQNMNNMNPNMQANYPNNQYYYQQYPNNQKYKQNQMSNSMQQVPTQYIPPSFTNFQNNYIENKPEDKKMKRKLSIKDKILSEDGGELPPPIQGKEGERPVLGATKIDQLMLVIQARDKNNGNDVKYTTAKDGTIIGDIEPQHLVGGVEKQRLEEYSDEELDSDGRRKKKKKIPQCPYCNKYFAQTTQLEVHVRSHIGYKPFECSYCQKRFTQGGNLTTHLRLHTGEKPFTCEICNRSFSRKGNLAAHKLTHENLKPFDCKLDDCDKSFTQLGNLKSHQNKFHLDTLNRLTTKLTELSTLEISQLPKKEQDLLNYFKNLYKNSNKGIKGRGKAKKLKDNMEMGNNLLDSNSSMNPIPNQLNQRLDSYGQVFMNNNYDNLYQN